MSKSPWWWVPTLFFAEGIPYFMVNQISVIMFNRMGVPNGEMAFFTGLIYLPWTIKPLWSPFVDIVRTKRWWVLAMQLLMTAAFVGLALTLPHPTPEMTAAHGTPVSMFTLTLILFIITAFASATHDIAADGFYMIALSSKQQSAFVGIRSTFYRISSIFGQGVLVVVAGLLEGRGNIPRAWMLTLAFTAVIFTAITLYHSLAIPRVDADASSLEAASDDLAAGVASGPEDGTALSAEGLPSDVDRGGRSAGAARERAVGSSKPAGSAIMREFGRAFTTFFRKPGIWLAIIFMLLYRLPEAFLLKMMNPFLMDSATEGGLALKTETVGLVYGTIGVLCLTIGGILGGLAASRWGLKKALWPMAACMTLPCLSFVYLSLIHPANLLVISSCVAVEQFGYGFGFTAYMLYMIFASEGEFKTSHYSICTAFMALSMMIPGMFAGYLQEWLGYAGFFDMVILCCLATVAVTVLVRRRVPEGFGRE